MKNFLLLLVFLSFCISVNSQDRNDTYRFSFGVNAIDNSGRQSPFSNINDWAFEQPFTIGFEYRISNLFAIEELFSLNKFSSGYIFDSVALNEDVRYFSADTNIKYYIGEYFLNSEKIDLFLTAGLGFYDIDFATFASANLGGGFVFWFNDDIGIGVQSLGKFTLGDKDKQFSSNHLQYFLQLIYRN